MLLTAHLCSIPFTMLLKESYKKSFIDLAAFLFIFLFTYAAVSKLIDHQKFRVQLGQSPILTPVAGWIAWIIPAAEILISVLLVLPAYRIVGLYASFGIMVMFTSYIIAITRFSEYIPCSCGGVLQHMNWNQHLLFNLLLVLLSLTSILFYQNKLTQ
jgi:uncharacterized membrane protein YphA (DoxX/SURF4 family)